MHSLMHVSRDFNTELTALYSALYVPASADSDAAREAEYGARYEHLRRTSRTAMLVGSLCIVRPLGGTVMLRRFDPASGTFRQVDWPPEWNTVRDWFQAKLALVIALSAYQGWLGAYGKKLANGQRPLSGKAVRLINEIPGIAAALIVVLVIVRPF